MFDKLNAWLTIAVVDSLDRCLCKQFFSFSRNFLRASTIRFDHNEHSFADGANNIIGFFWSLSLKVFDELSAASLPLKLLFPSFSPHKDNSLRNIGYERKVCLLITIVITWETLIYKIFFSEIWIHTFLYILNFGSLKRILLVERIVGSHSWGNRRVLYHFLTVTKLQQ